MATIGYTVRPPAVAGTFYPESRADLAETVTRLLATARAAAPEGPRRAPKAVIAPHAGYIYSGPIAATAFTAFSSIAAAIRKVVLLGPAHRVPVRGLALPEAKGFATPLGVVELDPEMAWAASRLPQVRLQPEAHAPEHSLEVELPFLQVLLGEFTILPLVVGEASGEEVAEVLEQVWGDEETAVVISSDLSHYLPYDTARQVDRATADAILRLEGPIDPRRACGAYPINGLLVAARRRGLVPELLDLRNSGDTAGDRRQVVGYGAFAFHA
jgi:AmmeMemoRadiSam system protein B